VTTGSSSDFRVRARYEARRYGADDWVFVRELLQNARDAGAARVWFEVGSDGGKDRVACRDDGDGMTFDHARKYLFTLYASSKRGGPRSAGRFGIGFWSILRFAPSAITVRSRPSGGAGWQVRLDGDLEVVRQESVRVDDPGTVVVIERETSGDDIAGLLRAAVLRDAPFVTRRGHPDRPLEVRINGEPVRADFDLPPPSMTFRRRELRGVVGLGSQPRVGIFVHGLRVREASSLDDLLLTGRRGRAGVPAMADGLAPQALIDSSALTVLLARSDAREDRSLRRLVAVGQRELRRLVRAELDRHARPAMLALLVERAREAWSTSRLVRAAIGVLLVAVGLAVGWRWITGGAAGWPDTGAVGTRETASQPPTAEPLPYADLGGLYRGPDADVLAGPSTAIALTYRPAVERVYFAALVIVGIDSAGAPVYPQGETPHPGAAPCGDGCLDVELEVAAGPGLLRLPVATGYLVDPDSVRLNGLAVTLAGELGGLPAVDLGEVGGGSLTYRSAPGPGVRPVRRGSWPPLPPELGRAGAEIGSLPEAARAAAAAEYVRRRVVYDASAVTANLHRAEQRRGRDLFERSLIIGAGDCDVQNAMVAALLEAAGTVSRLAVGWVGEGGRTLPGLHAWVEYLAEDGRWRVVDASAGSEPGRVSGGAPTGRGTPERASDPVAGPVILGAVSALLIGLALWYGGGRAHRSFSLGGRDDIAGLVRAAAVHPEAFAGMHALFARRLIPVLGGRSISMTRARTAAARGKLAVGGRDCDLAARAAARGTVIDGDDPVGAAAAAALGAADLDLWQGVLARSWSDPIATRVGEALRGVGERWRLVVADGTGEEIAVFDGPRLGLPGGERWLALNASGELWRTARDLAHRHPSAAILALADTVTDRLGLPQAARTACLAGLARAALDEPGGGGS
jgi:transglutaminase-like putative cysteine protease